MYLSLFANVLNIQVCLHNSSGKLILLSPGDLSNLMKPIHKGEAENPKPLLYKPQRLCLFTRPCGLPVIEIARFLKITDV